MLFDYIVVIPWHSERKEKLLDMSTSIAIWEFFYFDLGFFNIYTCMMYLNNDTGQNKLVF